jgi:hypothetical protein
MEGNRPMKVNSRATAEQAAKAIRNVLRDGEDNPLSASEWVDVANAAEQIKRYAAMVGNEMYLADDTIAHETKSR